MFFFNQTYVVETLQHFGILEFSEEEIQVPTHISAFTQPKALYMQYLQDMCLSDIDKI